MAADSKRKKAFLFLCILILLGIGAFTLYPYLQIESLFDLRDFIQQTVSNYPIFSLIMFLILTIGLINSPVPVVGPLGTLGGLMFGLWMGLAINIIFMLIACLVGFYLANTLLKDYIGPKIQKRTQTFTHHFSQRSILYVAIMRILPILPYFIINYYSGITHMSLRKYVLGSTIGITITVFFYTYLGSLLITVSSLDDLMSGQFFVIFLVLGFFLLLPLAFRKQLTQVLSKKHT